ncbi:hypothetical protein BJ912DRAFT_1039193 [Pholiota molesta]|nr:hypothetical protein BJ912DRAFT_1039193 [Pholiota molesta]
MTSVQARDNLYHPDYQNQPSNLSPLLHYGRHFPDLAFLYPLERFSSGKVTRDSEPGPSVKPERRSPSLPLLIEPERKLIRQSAKFFPMPATCRKSNPQFAEERRSYFRQKDDGLVIEWSSDVLVWSDTLKPEFLTSLLPSNVPTRLTIATYHARIPNDAERLCNERHLKSGKFPLSSHHRHNHPRPNESDLHQRNTGLMEFRGGVEARHEPFSAPPARRHRLRRASAGRRSPRERRSRSQRGPFKAAVHTTGSVSGIPSQEWRMRRGRCVILCADDVFLAVNPEGKEWFWVVKLPKRGSHCPFGFWCNARRGRVLMHERTGIRSGMFTDFARLDSNCIPT